MNSRVICFCVLVTFALAADEAKSSGPQTSVKQKTENSSRQPTKSSPNYCELLRLIKEEDKNAILDYLEKEFGSEKILKETLVKLNAVKRFEVMTAIVQIGCNRQTGRKDSVSGRKK